MSPPATALSQSAANRFDLFEALDLQADIGEDRRHFFGRQICFKVACQDVYKRQSFTLAQTSTFFSQSNPVAAAFSLMR